jgi:8-oxo-dGTP pyrophosphatase MutT (NUDIX family)
MDLHRIKNRLKQEHTLQGDEWKGAVLFLCDEKFVYLIRRSEEMPTHGGQMAFVGGHKKLDELDAWETVQREFEEETSHSRTIIEFLGFLPVVWTARFQPIVPVVAKLLIPAQDFLYSAKSNGEWVDIMSHPWEKLKDELSWNFAWRVGHSKSAVMFHTLKTRSYQSPHGNERAHLLWGATAGMIWELLRIYNQEKEK